MIWRIDVVPQESRADGKIASEIRDLGIGAQVSVAARTVYLIDGALSGPEIERIASRVLVDPVIERYSLSEGIFAEAPTDSDILITYNPGVCDAVASSLAKAIGDLGLCVQSCRTARFYRFSGLTRQEIRSVAAKLLYNPLIEHVLEYETGRALTTLDEFAGSRYVFKPVNVEILSAHDERLLEISKIGCLSLSLEEMKIIQAYFKRAGRNPTDCELETVATLWSEHCAHKTFRGVIEYSETDASGRTRTQRIDNLLKSTVMKATRQLDSRGCVSVFEDNSGVVRFDDKNNVCFKVETHNHPSSLEPYGGASTGIGGVIRDILGTGCAAKPFASVDVFCFSPWNITHERLPHGLLHPLRIMRGVIKGVRDYGNRMGIPTVAGAVLFDERFLGNPLVYCGTLGIMPKEKSFKKAEVGDLVILCGAATGRDGIHGATFSSKELDEHTVGLTSAVQIGNAIAEKKLTDAILRARDEDLFNAITDCGAGGISSAITELAQEHGVEVRLDEVPLKYTGLSYTEIWISESQERMVFFCKEKNLPELKRIFAEEDVTLSVVGVVTGTHRLVLTYQGERVCDLDMDFIFNLPKLSKTAVWQSRPEAHAAIEEKSEYTDDLRALLSSPNIAPKDWIVREYDHEVQAGSVVKSITGRRTVAVNDAAVVRPDLDSTRCVAVGMGINPFYSDIDPYWMAAAAIDEALRNVVCAGGALEETYVLDNFCWGSPQDPHLLGGLVRAAQACHDFSLYYRVPFISGKDSLYNEYEVGSKHISIPGTLLISALSVIQDARPGVCGQFTEAGRLVYAVGLTKPELGCSEYFRTHGIREGAVPKVDTTLARTVLMATSEAVKTGLVTACHDCSEGGIAVSVAEMSIGSGLGCDIFLGEVPAQPGMRNFEILFSESPTRFIVEVAKDSKEAFEKAMGNVPFGLIGCVSTEPFVRMHGASGRAVVSAPLADLEQSWLSTFKAFR